MECGLRKPLQHPTLPETGWPVQSKRSAHSAHGLAHHGTQVGPSCKWQPGLFCPFPLQALAPGRNVLRKRVTSLLGVLLDSHLQLQPGCFAMSLEKAFIPGRLREWNAPCQQGCG